MRRVALAVALASILAVPAVAAPDAVVYIEVAKGYQGFLWSGIPGAGVLPGTGNGSGFVIDPAAFLGVGGDWTCALAQEDIVVVTNEHVARGANELDVHFTEDVDGGESRRAAVPGRVIASDQRVDLALVEVRAAELLARGLDPAGIARLRPWPLAPADLPRGTPVEALGNPIGLRRVMTSGIVSSAQQEVPVGHPYVPLFRVVQTDAAISGGNSGGPLVAAASGEVVGINSFSASGENLNFAVPARRIQVFLRQVACGGRLRHGTLSVLSEVVTERTRGLLGLPAQVGTIILRAPDRSVGEGLQELDVVLAVKGTRQREAGGGAVTLPIGSGGVPLDEALFDLEPGTPVVLSVVRSGAVMDVTETVESLDLRGAGRDDVLELLGAHLERITSDVRRDWMIRGDGLMCGHVREGSVAAQAGLQVLDVVQRILLRDDRGLRVVDVSSVGSLQAEAAALTAAVERARAEGVPMALGFEVWNARWRDRQVRVLRVAGRAGGEATRR